MFRILFVALALSLDCCAYAQHRAEMQTQPVDPASSTLRWTGHAEVGSYAPFGTLTVQDGKISFRGASFENASLDIDMHSMKQDNEQLLHHLESADFFDVDRYPTSKLQIDRFDGHTIWGRLTIKDKTAPIECPVVISKKNGELLISGKITLDRTKSASSTTQTASSPGWETRPSATPLKLNSP